MGVTPSALQLGGVHAALDERFALELPDLQVEPGELVVVEAPLSLTGNLADLLAGRGRIRLEVGRMELGGLPLTGLSPEGRIRRGLHAPRRSSRALRSVQGFERLLEEANRDRRLQGRPPHPPLTGILRAGVSPYLGRGGPRPTRRGDGLASRLAMARLVEAPLVVLAVDEEPDEGIQELLVDTLSEARDGGRGVLVLGEPGDVTARLPDLRCAGSVEVRAVRGLAV